MLSKEDSNLLQKRLLAGLLLAGLAGGCKAQSTPQAGSALPMNRRIEVMVRSTFNLPPHIDVTLGARKPSNIPGYDKLPVLLSSGGVSKEMDFLISKDGKTLARLEKFDLASNPVFSIDVKGRPIRGNPNAKVTVINFDDLECPYCSRMHDTLFPSTLERYKNQVRFIYMDNPLVEIHPWAMHAAVDADCLAAQNGTAYWKFVDYIHSHEDEVTGPDRNPARSVATLDRLAREQGTAARVNIGKLDACLAKQDETVVRQSMHLADVLGADGAPALFVEGERIVGAIPEPELWIVIDRALRDAGEQPPPDTGATAAGGQGGR